VHFNAQHRVKSHVFLRHNVPKLQCGIYMRILWVICLWRYCYLLKLFFVWVDTDDIPTVLNIRLVAHYWNLCNFRDSFVNTIIKCWIYVFCKAVKFVGLDFDHAKSWHKLFLDVQE
jgi:hypothetical protein